MPTQWYFVENGKRPGERIIAKYHPDGTIHTVASAFPDKYGYIYKIYPVKYGIYSSIKNSGVISIREIDMRGFKGK